MKILNSAQIKELDSVTIQKQGISSTSLMERAATAAVEWIAKHIDKEKTIKIICGTGNNGGDGLAIARLLKEKLYEVQIFIIHSDKCSPEFTANEQRLSKIAVINYIKAAVDFPCFLPNDVIVDAILGTGLNRATTGLYAEVIDAINASPSSIISIDIASGLFTDTEQLSTSIIKPRYTMSFQLPKLAFMAPENGDYVGEWHLLDIGLDKEYIQQADTCYYYLQKDFALHTVKRRKKFSHKNSYGSALIIAGHYGMIGAAVLCAKACLKTGTGLCRTYTPKCGYEILQVAVPENMCITDVHDECITDIPDVSAYNAIGVGPGIGQKEETKEAIIKLFTTIGKPLVIDADALNIIGADKVLVDVIPEGSILTPHPGELARLTGKATNYYKQLEEAKRIAKTIKGILILKGAHTAIVTWEGTVCFNSTGNAGMATAGSGDVLTGIITGLLAQGYTSIEAAKLGVYLHGAAGDFAAEKFSEHSVSATDIINNISEFYKSVM